MKGSCLCGQVEYDAVQLDSPHPLADIGEEHLLLGDALSREIVHDLRWRSDPSAIVHTAISSKGS
jgi:hypothetical protein